MSTITIPGFTAERCLYHRTMRFDVASASPSRATAGTVQVARSMGNPIECRPFLNAFLAAHQRGDELWADFWAGAWDAVAKRTDRRPKPAVRHAR